MAAMQLPRSNAPGWIRTNDLRIRSPLLYPAELQGPTTFQSCHSARLAASVFLADRVDCSYARLKTQRRPTKYVTAGVIGNSTA